ncbi:MAG: EFR1 family ferrodoxin [Spirochaetes bacterium]|nr:EFR1 family ferrodoxin [Spirochaetota bacterium]
MAKYKKVVLYYFTGTGNALRAARWILEKASSMAMDAELHAIDRGYRPDISTLDSSTLVGFLYPTHGFNAAPSMIYFLLKFPRIRGGHAFVLNTRAGSKIFRFLGPGLSGLAQVLPMAILAIKGFSVRGGLPLDMPSNWISLHPGYSDRWISFIVRRCEEITMDFAGAILSGHRRFFRSLITLPIDLAIAPVAVIYFLIGRFMLAKTFIYSSNCNDCMICVNNCPVGAIEIRHGKPYWKLTCESCMRCIDNCPQQAIQASHLFFLIIVLISQIPFTAYLFTAMPLLSVINHRWIVSFLNAYIVLLIVFFLYGLLQMLLRLKPVNALFTFTSLTRYWRRYRAPGITLRDYRSDRPGGRGEKS